MADLKVAVDIKKEDMDNEESLNMTEIDVAIDINEEVMGNDDAELYNSIMETSQYFTSIVELIPGKFYLNQESEEGEYRGKKKRKVKQENKKLLAKKAKLFKLDPGQHKSILELQKEIELKEQSLCDDDNHVSNIEPISVPNIKSASLEDLRERMEQKLNILRGNRKIPNKGDKDKARVEKKRLNDHKRKKLEKSTHIKIVNDIESKAMPDVDRDSKNERSGVVFSKFDFASGEIRDPKKKKKKDLKKLLEVAEKKRDKISELEKTDAEKAEGMKKKISWDSALKKAEGVKLKDDPKLIKKTIKRKEKLKDKSAKKWEDRIETVDKQMKEKQEKRKENIKERKEAKINKKINKKSGKSKHKSKPGF